VNASLTEILDADRVRRAEAIPCDQMSDGQEDAAPEPAEISDSNDTPSASDGLPESPVAQAAMLFARGPAHDLQTLGTGGTQSAATPDANRFFEDSYTPQLLALMEQIVASEGPMPEASLARSISQIHGWQRTGARIQARIAALHGIFEMTMEGDNRLLWTRGSVRDRVPFRDMANRSLREISQTEIADLIDRSLTKIAAAEDPDIELARLAGIGRLSKDAREYLNACREWRELPATQL
jgi:hypothetical protein